MTAAVLTASPVQKFWTNGGEPLAFGYVYTYSAGTTTPVATYVDSTALTPNANPILLNARGEANIWILPNVAYKYVVTDGFGNTISTTDNITNQQLITLFGGIDTGAANAYILNFTASFTSLTNGIVIYWIPANNNTGASTINVNNLGVVNIVNPSGTSLGANQIIANQMAQMIYYNGVWQLLSIGNFQGVTIGTFGTESTVASATTTDLGSATAHVVKVTGNASITFFGTSAQTVAPIYIVRFTGTATLNNTSSLVLPGGQNIVTQAGDALIAQYQGSNVWQVLLYQRQSASTGTFNGTATGFSGALTPGEPTVTWTLSSTMSGPIVSLNIPGFYGTSNATTLTITGMPASLYPARNQLQLYAGVENGGATSQYAGSVVIGSTGTMTFWPFADVGATAWTNTGTKGIGVGTNSGDITLTYPLT
jgi:hypothetical protein